MRIPYDNKNKKNSATPSQSTLKYGSENRPYMRGLRKKSFKTYFSFAATNAFNL